VKAEMEFKSFLIQGSNLDSKLQKGIKKGTESFGSTTIKLLLKDQDQ
jgi:hypothetical protein